MNRCWCLTYRVECDFLPFRRFYLSAECEHDARAAVALAMGVPYEETTAFIEEVQA